MNMIKIENRIKEINNIFDKNLTHKNNTGYQLLIERNELEFKRNKQNINFRLTCNNKYYYANQCYQFAKHILKNGYPYKNINDISFISDISFNKHSITINNSDIKRFNNKDELLGFVIGYNTANNIA
jgi:hypothetical protein